MCSQPSGVLTHELKVEVARHVCRVFGRIYPTSPVTPDPVVFDAGSEPWSSACSSTRYSLR